MVGKKKGGIASTLNNTFYNEMRYYKYRYM